MAVNSTNYNYRRITEGGVMDKHILTLSNSDYLSPDNPENIPMTELPLIGTNSYTTGWNTPESKTSTTQSNVFNNYWQIRINTETETQQMKDYTDWFFFPASSNNEFLDNSISCRWGMTGGSGIYTVEIPALGAFSGINGTGSQLTHIIAWDLNPTTPTYVYIQDTLTGAGSSDKSITIIENGVSETNWTISSSFNTKYHWNKSTNILTILSGDFVEDFYNTIVGTYSFTSPSTDEPPIFSYKPELRTDDIIFLGNHDNDNVINKYVLTNYDPAGLTGSNIFFTENKPPSSLMIEDPILQKTNL
jgi:hypothetical protein